MIKLSEPYLPGSPERQELIDGGYLHESYLHEPEDVWPLLKAQGTKMIVPYQDDPNKIEHSVNAFLRGECKCNTCMLHFGIERGTGHDRKNEEMVRAKWQKKLAGVVAVVVVVVVAVR